MTVAPILSTRRRDLGDGLQILQIGVVVDKRLFQKMTFGAECVDEGSVATGSSGDGELGVRCNELHDPHGLPVTTASACSTGTRFPYLQSKNVHC